jgi:elongation factor Ts
MQISAAMVKQLREKTGAGIMDCKAALAATEGDVEKAIDYLREKGLSAAGKKSSRITSDGLIGTYVHAGGKIGVIVEVNCETDFVAKTDDFAGFVKDLTLHIAAANPEYLKREDIPEPVIERERNILVNQARDTGKPEKVIEKIVSGRMEKFFAENCLMEQAFVKDPDISIEELRTQMVAKTGENVVVRRFIRYHLGEGLEKRQDDLASEVASQVSAKCE